MPSDRRRRSRSPREHKKKKDKTSSRLERKRKRDDEPEPSPPRKERKEEGERPTSPPAQERGDEGDSGGQQGEISISVEETNKLREKLGLKPLDATEGDSVVDSETVPGDKIVTEDGKTFTHRAPENWGDKRKEVSIREKLAIARDKRRLAERFGGKGLGDEEEEEDSAAAWVEKMRKKEEEKRQAEQRAKMLEEMDETFGVGDLIDKDVKKKKAKANRAAASRLPKGFTVEHSKEQFLEGSGETVLVLKDKGVLDEGDEETLINPTMMEHEQWKRNAEIRKRKPGYNPYADILDEDGNLKDRGILDKYDEENLANDGLPKKDTFSISETGDVDLGPERRQAEIKARLREAKEALRNTAETPLLEPAREYYTSEEMAAFKKPRKKKAKEGLRKKRTGGALKADDLVAESGDADFGSRNRGKGKKKAAFEGDAPEGSALGDGDEDSLAVLLPAPQEVDEDDLWGPEGDLAGVVVDDEAEDELAFALEKARKIKTTTVKEDPSADAGEKVAKMLTHHPAVKTEPTEEEEELATEEGKITMDATSEYCRHLGDEPANLAGLPSSSAKIDVEEDDEEEALGRRKRRSKDEERKRKRAKWRTIEDGVVKADLDDQAPMDSEGDSSDSEDMEQLLGAEAKASSSVADAIRLAVQKGYLEPAKRSEDEAKLKELECKRYSQIDRQFADIDDKYSRKLERMGMGGGPVRSFEERKDYKPNVNLTYCDETGRPMDTKQAFRYMSWKFHGKKPGKMKTEKRRIKLEENEKVTRLDSADTPLGTLDKQRKKQEREGMPFVPLSGHASQIALPKD